LSLGKARGTTRNEEPHGEKIGYHRRLDPFIRAGRGARCTKGKDSVQCHLVCHAIGPGAQNKIGPELNGLDGRKAGTVPNFDYSDTNKNSGIVWNEKTFEFRRR
jgi:cytochrome c2